MATVLSVLDRVRSRRSQVRQQAAANYQDLVRSVAVDGHQPTEDEIDILVDDLDQFAADIERRKERHRLALVVATEPALEAERDKLFVAQKADGAELFRLQREHEERVGKRQGEINALSTQINACDAARRQLRKTADNNGREPQIIERLKVLGVEQRELVENLDPHSSTRNVAIFRSQCSEDQRVGAQRRYDAAQSRLASVRKEIAELQAERGELDEIKLLP